MSILMDIERNDTRYKVRYEQFLFSDGQPHLKLEESVVDSVVTVTTRLTSALDVLELLLLKDVLNVGNNVVDLDILYMLGARMDRRIDFKQPFTLKVITDLIKGAGFRKIRILDPHSDACLVLLDAQAVYPINEVFSVFNLKTEQVGDESLVVVIPDSGAKTRVQTIMGAIKHANPKKYPYPNPMHIPIVQGFKHRDSQTGRLSGFSVEDPKAVEGKHCLIIDDICDGGGTFVGLAEKLRDAGATGVDLFVTHGIFSKGYKLTGIDHIFTTDSYGRWSSERGLTVFPCRLRPAV